LFPKDANFNFRPSFSPISAAVKDLRFGRDPAVLESAKSISIVAEMSVKRSTALGSGSSSEDGTLAVTAKDIGDLTWRDLLRALAAYRLPPDVRALEIILPGRGSGPVRTIFLSADLLRAFLQFPLADRQTIMAAASSVRPDEAQAAIVRAVAVAERETNGIGPVGRQELPPGMTAAALAEAIAEAQRQARWFECFGTPLASKLLSHFAEGTGTDYVLTGSDLGRVLVSSKFGEMKDAVTARFKGRLAGAHLTGKDEPFTWDGGQQVVRYDKPGSRLDRSWDADMFYSFHNLYVKVSFVGEARCIGGSNAWHGTTKYHVYDRYQFANRPWHPIPGVPSTTDDLFWLWQEYGDAKGFKVYGDMDYRQSFAVTRSGAGAAGGTPGGGGGYPGY
jgi:hypothetical protein